MNIEIELLEAKKLWLNDGQIPGLPKNPRFIRDERFKALVKSIEDDPEMLQLRECIVFPYANEYVVIAGNMRLRACLDLKIKKIPCKILPNDTSIEKLKAYIIKDNVAFGNDDFDLLANEWDHQELTDWGMVLPVFNTEEEPELEKEKTSIVKLVIEFDSLSDYDTVKAEVKAILESYEGAKIKE